MSYSPVVALVVFLVLPFALYLTDRLFLETHPRSRLTVRLGALLSLVLFCGVLGSLTTPAACAWFIPYEREGAVDTVDVQGRPCRVEVWAKSLSHSIPPGVLPRVKVAGPSGSVTVDTGWRFGVGAMRAVDGGLEVFSSYPRPHGYRFEIGEDGLRVAAEDILGRPARDFPDVKARVAPELYELIRRLDEVDGLEGGWFNPTTLVRAVNALQRSGKDRAVEAIRAYAKHWRDLDAGGGIWLDRELDRLLLVLRALFVPREKGAVFPKIQRGVPRVVEGEELFPLVVFDGLPFVLAPHQGRYAHDGPAEDPLAQLETYLESFELRSTPWAPDASPLDALAALEASPLRRDLEQADGSYTYLRKGGLRAQALFALSTMLPLTAADYSDLTHHDVDVAERVWGPKVAAARALQPRWDPRREEFVPGVARVR